MPLTGWHRKPANVELGGVLLSSGCEHARHPEQSLQSAGRLLRVAEENRTLPCFALPESAGESLAQHL